MTYLEWNEHIAKFFFKPENAGRDIMFYLTKQDLIKYSRSFFSSKSDDEIWADFIHANLGIFELKKFGNRNWIHVGKPFSQCILSPSAINKLPELFYEAGLIPDSVYSKEEFRKIILKHDSKILVFLH